MSSQLAVPPRFLLPAWSSAQLSQLRLQHTTTPPSHKRSQTFIQPKVDGETALFRYSLHGRTKADNPYFQHWNDKIKHKQRSNKENAGKFAALAEVAKAQAKAKPRTDPRLPQTKHVSAMEEVYTEENKISSEKPGARPPWSTPASQMNVFEDVYKTSSTRQRVRPPSRQRGSATSVDAGASKIVPAQSRTDRLLGHRAETRTVETQVEKIDPAEHRPSLFDELFPEEATSVSENDASSLFQELFPMEAEQRGKRDKPTKDNLHLDFPYSPAASPAPRSQGKKDSILDFVPSPLQKTHWQQDRLTIMVVMGLDPSLDESDFQRLLPRGEHIPQWRSPGDVLRVIVARDPETLAPRPLHYLVFANPTMAKAYKAYLEHVHALAGKYTPTSLLSEPLPPRGYFVQGTNVHQLLQDYTLSAPSQTLRMRVLLPPYDRRLTQLLEHQGYAALQGTGIGAENAPVIEEAPVKKAGRSALLWIEGYMPHTSGILHMLRQDGAARGLAWSATIRSDAYADEDVPEGSRGEVVELLQGADSPPASPTSERHTETPTEGDAENQASAGAFQKGTRLTPPRWLLTFRDESEARRFVRTWHRRPYPMSHRRERFHLRAVAAKGDGGDDGEPTVHVQYVW